MTLYYMSMCMLVIGVVVGVVAAVIIGYIIWRQLHPKASHVEIVPWVSPSGGGITAMGQF